MMYNFPFFPHFYPNFNRNYPQNSSKYVNNAIYHTNHYNSTNNNSHKIRNIIDYNKKNMQASSVNFHKNIDDNNSSSQRKMNKEEERCLENTDTIFEIFGIKLHFDDILLICLIFFLYNEGVKDEFLFIALILLLLS